ncbi:MAG: hypothetical protein HQ477_11930 [Chloroflexi bacterium]|nr:hypothetical protein [Chloroflexota bacterium]
MLYRITDFFVQLALSAATRGLDSLITNRGRIASKIKIRFRIQTDPGFRRTVGASPRLYPLIVLSFIVSTAPTISKLSFHAGLYSEFSVSYAIFYALALAMVAQEMARAAIWYGRLKIAMRRTKWFPPKMAIFAEGALFGFSCSEIGIAEGRNDVIRSGSRLLVGEKIKKQLPEEELDALIISEISRSTIPRCSLLVLGLIVGIGVSYASVASNAPIFSIPATLAVSFASFVLLRRARRVQGDSDTVRLGHGPRLLNALISLSKNERNVWRASLLEPSLDQRIRYVALITKSTEPDRH